MKTIMILVALAFLCSCVGKKSFIEGKEVIIPCSGKEFMSNGEYFRENAMGSSHSLEIATQKAMTIARSKIASAVHVTVKVVTDNYLSSTEVINPKFMLANMTDKEREKAIKQTRKQAKKDEKEKEFYANLGLEKGGLKMPALISFNIDEDLVKFQSLTREITNRTLKGVKVIYKKVTQSEEGNYICFVCLEMSSVALVDNLKEASSRAKLKTDFEYEKYMKIFEEELRKQSNLD